MAYMFWPRAPTAASFHAPPSPLACLLPPDATSTFSLRPLHFSAHCLLGSFRGTRWLAPAAHLGFCTNGISLERPSRAPVDIPLPHPFPCLIFLSSFPHPVACYPCDHLCLQLQGDLYEVGASILFSAVPLHLAQCFEHSRCSVSLFDVNK